MKIVTRTVGAFSFITGIIHLSNEELLLGAALSFAGILLFRSDWDK